jgi:preprotein translocase subunit SecA
MAVEFAHAMAYGIYPEKRRPQRSARIEGARAERQAASFLATVRAAGVAPRYGADIRDVAAKLRAPATSHAAAIRCFALTDAAVRAALGVAAYDEQILGAWHMLNGRLIEMETGEGKTLAAVFAIVALALAGARVHVVTTNDYLAERDATQMAPVFARLGLTVGCVKEGMGVGERQTAYGCGVTYVTPKQLMFDYLRDQIELGPKSGHPLRAEVDIGRARGEERRFYLRGLQAAIVDEADSILIDEAIVPLLLSRQEPAADQAFVARQAIELAERLVRGVDFSVAPDERNLALTARGADELERLGKAAGGVFASRMWREQYALQALMALHLFRRDHDYIVRGGNVQIVDVGTGRTMPDRSWERGLQQMIQSKEGLAITAPNESIARISHQDFFGRYLFLAGMSGTLGEVAREIRRTYGLDVIRVPTHRPSLRRDLGTTVCATNAEKRRIIALKVRDCTARSQPVLIGTRTVADSELLSAELEACGLAHTLLNARRDAEEADIIAKAGRAGAVTVATNMAGRGTDIKIEAEARAAGGLHVIASERHESRRIDRQLFGRAARQGDPGSFEEIIALDDRLTAGLPAWRRALAARLSLGGWLIRFAQWRATRHGARLRRRLAQYEARMQQTLSFAGSANDLKKVDVN